MNSYIPDIKPGEQIKDVHFSGDSLRVDLMNGRTISVPLAWYPRLLDASAELRSNWKPAGGGFGILKRILPISYCVHRESDAWSFLERGTRPWISIRN